jgi:alkylation response protein AidB-like acyl-CoA dehydrogenase
VINIAETPAELEFRREVAAYLDDCVPAQLRASANYADLLEVDRLLAGAAYLCYSWPAQFGGQGGSPTMAAILDEERAAHGVPGFRSPSRFGTNLLGPTLMAHGTPDQLDAFLPNIATARHIWCQGFSEPDAGSDLASVRCSAVRIGDHFEVTGSKVWTTQAQHADWCFALVRTGSREDRYHNLSFVLIDMQSSGISVRPLVQSTGDCEFNEVFFERTQVSAAHVVGAVDEGWRVAMTTLSAERSYGQLGRYRQYAAELERIRVALQVAGLAGDQYWRRRYAQVKIALMGIRNLSYKITSVSAAGEDPGVAPSMIKLWWSTTHQQLVDLGYDLAVTSGRELDYWMPLFLRTRAETIFAGTSQIQRNIVSERGLGLPR